MPCEPPYRFVALPRRGATMTALAAALLLGGCQSGLSPVVPSGAEAYGVIAPEEPDEAAATRYALRGGDVVSVAVFQEPELSRDRIALDAAGNLNLPLLGEIRARGFTTSELAREIERAYAMQYLRDPRVAVFLDESVKDQIAIEGQVELPGVYEYRTGLTLLSAMALARSPTRIAKLDEIVIFRTVGGERLGGVFDLEAIREGRMPDPALRPGDTIVVGYSSVQGAYRDIIQTAPLLGVFTRF